MYSQVYTSTSRIYVVNGLASFRIFRFSQEPMTAVFVLTLEPSLALRGNKKLYSSSPTDANGTHCRKRVINIYKNDP